MADGTLTITITGDNATKLEERAKALGLPAQSVVVDMIGRMMDDGTGLQREPTAPQDYDGPYVELEDALADFDAELERRLAARAG